MDYKNIMRIIPLVHTVKLVEDNVSFSKKKKKNYTKQAVKNVVGLSLIGIESSMINDL